MDNGQRQVSAAMNQSCGAALGICPHLAGLRWKRLRRDRARFLTYMDILKNGVLARTVCDNFSGWARDSKFL
jgi:hypothetical protein